MEKKIVFLLVGVVIGSVAYNYYTKSYKPNQNA